MTGLLYEGVSFSIEYAGSMSLKEFIAAGINYGWYGEYGDNQLPLLKEAYRLIKSYG
jgi:hypothetical protein